MAPRLPQTPLRSLPAAGVTFAGDAVGSARARMAVEVRRLVAGDRPPVRDLQVPIEGDPGLFGPQSVTWRIHADSAMFVGGVRALLLQTLHPLAMAGVADHSAYRSDPLGRLARTAGYVGTTTYGTTAQADEAIDMVRRVHGAVVGTAPDGRPYDANDPHLMLWVHHALVDSFLRAYRRYGAEPLSDAEADRYVDEMAVVGERLGTDPPARSVAELRSWFQRIRPELRPGAQSREAARWLMVPPLPLALRPAYGVIAASAVGLLPRWARARLWLPMAPGADPLLVRPATTVLLRTISWVMAGYPADTAPGPPTTNAA